MKTLRSVFAPVLGVKPEELNKKSSSKTISSWDSVINLILLTEIEKEYSTSISIEEVYNLEDLGDVFELLRHKGVPLKF